MNSFDPPRIGNFGTDAAKDEVRLAIRWLDFVIRGIDDGISDEPPVNIFTMGVNQWSGEHEWPLARSEFTKFYLHSLETKDGWLSVEPPELEPPTRYTYDPDDPVPTLGGNHSSPIIPGIMQVGSIDQRPNEERPDVLVFTSAPLVADVEVTGPVVAKLWAASSARDTDFIVRLIDVYPDGTAYNLTEGILRARFRASIWEPPQMLVPGEICAYSNLADGSSERVNTPDGHEPLPGAHEYPMTVKMVFMASLLGIFAAHAIADPPQFGARINRGSVENSAIKEASGLVASRKSSRLNVFVK